MSPTPLDPQRLEADLAELRAALRGVPVPPLDEAALRAAFRAKQRERAVVAVAGGRRLRFAAVAAAALATAAGLGVVLLGVERPAPAPVAATAPPAESALPVAAFQPLLSSPGLSPTGSYSVVRVRIPLSALALVPGTEQSGTIEADLLVGEDGLARGIRFNTAGAAYAAADAR